MLDIDEIMDKKELKILKKLVSEGYSLNAHHSNPNWKTALEAAESLLIDKTKFKRHVLPEVCQRPAEETQY